MYQIISIIIIKLAVHIFMILKVLFIVDDIANHRKVNGNDNKLAISAKFANLFKLTDFNVIKDNTNKIILIMNKIIKIILIIYIS